MSFALNWLSSCPETLEPIFWLWFKLESLLDDIFKTVEDDDKSLTVVEINDELDDEFWCNDDDDDACFKILEDETMEDTALLLDAGFDFSFCFMLSELSFELLFDDFDPLSRDEVDDVDEDVLSFSWPVFELDLLLILLVCLSFSFEIFDIDLLFEPPTIEIADEDAGLFMAGFELLPLELLPLPLPITELDVLGTVFGTDEIELFDALLDFLCFVVNDDGASIDEDTIDVETDDELGSANFSEPDDAADVLGRVFPCVLLSFSGDDGESDDPVSWVIGL